MSHSFITRTNLYYNLCQGLRPTANDRERIASGIDLSEHLALAVKEAQQQVLHRHKTSIKQRESKFFEEMDAQRKLEKARFLVAFLK